MGRYSWNSWDGTQDAYDEGHRGGSCWRNPYERHGDFEEEQRHKAFDEGCSDRRREEERREEERQEEEAREADYRRRQEEEAAMEEAYYEECMAQEPGPPEDPEAF